MGHGGFPLPEPARAPVGVPLTRSDPDSVRLRKRLELPGNVGRYVLTVLGSVAAAAAAGLVLTQTSLLADGLLVFGGILVLLGISQHLLLKRDRAHWPEQAYLWTDGLELLLHNGEIRAVSWSDPKLTLDVYVRPRRPADEDETLLIWKMDSRVPPIPLSTEGFERLREAAHARGLELGEFRDGRGRGGIRAYEIRPAATASNAAGSGTKPSSSIP